MRAVYILTSALTDVCRVMLLAVIEDRYPVFREQTLGIKYDANKDLMQSKKITGTSH